jgi:hypothetical protein
MYKNTQMKQNQKKQGSCHIDKGSDVTPSVTGNSSINISTNRENVNLLSFN